MQEKEGKTLLRKIRFAWNMYMLVNGQDLWSLDNHNLLLSWFINEQQLVFVCLLLSDTYQTDMANRTLTVQRKQLKKVQYKNVLKNVSKKTKNKGEKKMPCLSIYIFFNTTTQAKIVFTFLVCIMTVLDLLPQQC